MWWQVSENIDGNSLDFGLLTNSPAFLSQDLCTQSQINLTLSDIWAGFVSPQVVHCVATFRCARSGSRRDLKMKSFWKIRMRIVRVRCCRLTFWIFRQECGSFAKIQENTQNQFDSKVFITLRAWWMRAIEKRKIVFSLFNLNYQIIAWIILSKWLRYLLVEFKINFRFHLPVWSEQELFRTMDFPIGMHT